MCQDEDENEDEKQRFGSFWNLGLTNEPMIQCILILRASSFVTGFILNERKVSSSGSFSFSSWHTNCLLSMQMYFLAMHSGLVPQATLSANASGCCRYPEKRPRSPRKKALPGYADGIHAPPGPHPVSHPVPQVQAPAGSHHSVASQVTWRPGQARAQPKNGRHTQNTEPCQVWSLAQFLSCLLIHQMFRPGRVETQYTYLKLFVRIQLVSKAACKARELL